MNRPGEEKPAFSTLPLRAVLETAKPMMHGAQKHGAEDWRDRDPQLFFDALVRHGVARHLGEMCDPESGLLHSAHMAANALILIEHDLTSIAVAPAVNWRRILADSRTEDFNRRHAA